MESACFAGRRTALGWWWLVAQDHLITGVTVARATAAIAATYVTTKTLLTNSMTVAGSTIGARIFGWLTSKMGKQSKLPKATIGTIATRNGPRTASASPSFQIAPAKNMTKIAILTFG